MSLIPIDVAMQHVYADEADKDQVERKLASAISTAEQYMGRRLYTNNDEMQVAKAIALTEIANYAAALTEKTAILNPTPFDILQLEITQEAIYSLKLIARGIVINPAIEIGILLIFGDLYKNRENSVDSTVAELPMAAKHHLQPFRIMGV